MSLRLDWLFTPRKEKCSLCKKRPDGGWRVPGCIAGSPEAGVLTVWLFSMNWTALSFTSFLTLLYVSGSRVKEKNRTAATQTVHRRKHRQGYPRDRSFSSWSVLEVIGSH